ncbi:phosphatase PAP2 family protein [Roseibium sp. RKSG952]|uniref:phosphatase PAP2 family protein n=1 Tax=Roseibium sp. RKSG952 TaxID=2529384 RepID=UPI0012BD4F34|nr:phosphatase PAP2 family protein [Roseibium sp. RKSG952]MTH96245.1 phosphatase PAP2 family protein [Roseibium sp. RKSG952]
MKQQGIGGRFRLVGGRMRANMRRVGQIFANRRDRADGLKVPLKPGQRPQDILAVLVLTVGIAVIVFDIPSFPWIRSLPSEYWATFNFFTDIGKSGWILWSTGVVCLALLCLNAQELTFRMRMTVGAVFTYAGFVFYSVAGSGVLAILFKWSLGRARPKLYEQLGPVHFELFAFKSSFASFPSGHSTTVGALATALALLFPGYRWLIAVAAFWAAFSRIMVGAHYPSDVIAGILLGFTFTFFTARALARRRISFQYTDSGAVVPIMGPVSAKACVAAVWYALRGRRNAVRMSETDTAPRREHTQDKP